MVATGCHCDTVTQSDQGVAESKQETETASRSVSTRVQSGSNSNTMQDCTVPNKTSVPSTVRHAHGGNATRCLATSYRQLKLNSVCCICKSAEPTDHLSTHSRPMHNSKGPVLIPPTRRRVMRGSQLQHHNIVLHSLGVGAEAMAEGESAVSLT
jgi:hypothetical protein